MTIGVSDAPRVTVSRFAVVERSLESVIPDWMILYWLSPVFPMTTWRLTSSPGENSLVPAICASGSRLPVMNFVPASTGVTV